MAQPGKVLARGLFIFIMLVLEKLWKPASLCSRMVWFFVWGVEGICVHLCVIVPVRTLLCVLCSSQPTETAGQH